ncbi:MAG: ATP-binding protein [Chloroflexi bacterium]|nr:ATP-binding protein [Chloroflexota bacterium]
MIRITAVLQNPHDPAQRHMLVSVCDEGPGLPADLANTVFDKFVTGPDKRSGNGLGLAFCQMALAAHNQKIWFNEPGSDGATITFSLALPPQLPEDIRIEDKWPNTNPAAADPPSS